ncbi:MAG TPA: transposase [Pyrinomonadaceae bacterium]|nr:transposase [Pyrinomonadaceae bacterium]
MSHETATPPDRGRWHSRGYLPHFDRSELLQFITCHLAGSLPKRVLQRWKAELPNQDLVEEQILLQRRIEKYLDQGYGAAYLKQPSLAWMVQNSLLHFDGERYRLSAWVVMPNHVHLLATALPGHSLSELMHSIKSYTAHEANKLLRRTGQFWIEDYFDRYIRDVEHFSNTIRYIENNPVKAKLCAKPEDWPFSSAWFRARRKK